MGADRTALTEPWLLQSANVSPSVVGTAVASFPTFLSLLAVQAPTDGVQATTAGASDAHDGLGATYAYRALYDSLPVFPYSGRPIGDTAGAWVQTSQTGAGTVAAGDVTGTVGNNKVAKVSGAAVPVSAPTVGDALLAASPTALTFGPPSNAVATSAALDAVTAVSGVGKTTAGYSAVADGGGGVWVFVPGATTATNGGTVRSAVGGRSYRVFDGATFSPKWFGAQGNWNGSTGADDTIALQATLTAAAGALCVIPPGIYKITSTLTVPANTKVYAYGATITTSGQINAILFTDGGELRGLTLTGPAAATYNGSAIGVKCTGTNNGASAPTFVNAPLIKDCRISNFGLYGVNFAYVNGGTVETSSITGIGYAGIGGTSCNDTVVNANTISAIGPGPGTGDSYGVFIDRSNGTSETSDPRSSRCAITNNSISYVVGVYVGAPPIVYNGQGIDTHAGVDFNISGNRIRGCHIGIGIVASAISGAYQLSPQRVSVIGNSIDGRDGASPPADFNYNCAIIVSGAIGNNAGASDKYAQGVVIKGNSILNHGFPNDFTIGAISLGGTKGAVCVANTLRNSQATGIVINGENRGIIVQGNTIIDPHDATLAVPGCVHVIGNNTSGYIGGNTFALDNAALDTKVSVESIRIDAGATGLDIEVARNSYVGVTAAHLTYNEGTATGVNSTGVYEDRGTVTVALVSGQPNNHTDVTFAKRFPGVPVAITATPNGTDFVPGGKLPVWMISAITAAGFTITAKPTDLGNWSASGNLVFTWIARL